MKTIEERAKIASEGYDDDGYSAGLYMGYVAGDTEQKAIDDEVIKKLMSIVEHSASVLGIGTKWFTEDARRAAIAALEREILDYLYA